MLVTLTRSETHLHGADIRVTHISFDTVEGSAVIQRTNKEDPKIDIRFHGTGGLDSDAALLPDMASSEAILMKTDRYFPGTQHFEMAT